MKKILLITSVIASSMAYGMNSSASSMSYRAPSMFDDYMRSREPHNIPSQDTWINDTGFAITINGGMVFAPQKCASCKENTDQSCRAQHPEFSRLLNNLAIAHQNEFVIRYDGRRIVMGTRKGAPQLEGYSPQACSLIIALRNKSSIKPLKINDPKLLRDVSVVIIHKGRLALVTKDNVLRA